MFITRFFDYIVRLMQLGRKLDAHQRIQIEQGFSAEFQNPIDGAYIEYREGDNLLIASVDFSWDNNVTLFTRSVEFWNEPEYRRLSEIEYERVINRITKYLSSWGKVTCDNSHLTSI
jgi:hypothetical protein